MQFADACIARRSGASLGFQKKNNLVCRGNLGDAV